MEPGSKSPTLSQTRDVPSRRSPAHVQVEFAQPRHIPRISRTGSELRWPPTDEHTPVRPLYSGFPLPVKLLLFDIDGTLVRVNDAGRTALVRAVSALTDRPISTENVSFSGRTDPDIFEAVLAENDLPTSDEVIAEALEAYVETMQEILSPGDVEVLPGVRPLLSRLDDRPDAHLGLVTGNVEPIAREKLSFHGLDEYFSFGAFGSDHADRTRLPALAAQRAARHTGHAFRPAEHATVIGDTVHDIHCARAVGARAVVVCTGRYERAELSRHSPDLLLDTFPAPGTFIGRVIDS